MASGKEHRRSFRLFGLKHDHTAGYAGAVGMSMTRWVWAHSGLENASKPSWSNRIIVSFALLPSLTATISFKMHRRGEEPFS